MTILSLKRSARPGYVALVVFSLAMLGAMGHVWLISARVSAEHMPLVRASAQVKLNATLAHLWFEEILSGDRHESMEEVWHRLASSKLYARAMIEGGQDAEGTIVQLQDPELRRMIREVEEKLSEFEAITIERRGAKQSAASGTNIDQKYDAVFDELIAMTEEVESELHQVIRRETRSGRRTQIFVMAGAVLLSIGFGIVFARFVSERERAEKTLVQKVQAEEEAREHRDRLAHVVRLATMSELAAEIAHEINQPLAAISASAAACRRRFDAGESGSEKARAGLELIQGEAERASDVLRRLRAFVEKRASRYELIDVNQLVRSVVKLAGFDPKIRDASIRLDLADSLPPAEADTVQIQQVLLNLVRNGLEAMRECEDGPADGVVVRTCLAGDNEIEFSVVDRGVGIPDDVADDPFRPFVTTKESGMGLGLSISQSIIGSHGGRIRFLRNREGRGTTFAFTLPAVARSKP